LLLRARENPESLRNLPDYNNRRFDDLNETAAHPLIVETRGLFVRHVSSEMCRAWGGATAAATYDRLQMAMHTLATPHCINGVCVSETKQRGSRPLMVVIIHSLSLHNVAGGSMGTVPQNIAEEAPRRAHCSHLGQGRTRTKKLLSNQNS
jgi:hypothetical protein